MTLHEIERAVRATGRDWRVLFRRHVGGWQCILCPDRGLSEAEYAVISQRLAAPDLSAEERRRNALRHRAVTGGGA
jgi:hypothetical protein